MAGRMVKVRPPKDLQMMMLGRVARRLEAAGDIDPFDPDDVASMGLMKTAAQALDIIESLIVEQNDRDWLEQGIINGTVAMADLSNAFGPDPVKTVATSVKRVRRK